MVSRLTATRLAPGRAKINVAVSCSIHGKFARCLRSCSTSGWRDPIGVFKASFRKDSNDVQFVMCHFGNPWLMDAAAVVEKNENVAADLSGLLEGKFDIPEFLEDKKRSPYQKADRLYQYSVDK